MNTERKETSEARKQLKEALIVLYGTQIREHIEWIETAIDIVIGHKLGNVYYNIRSGIYLMINKEVRNNNK